MAKFYFLGAFLAGICILINVREKNYGAIMGWATACLLFLYNARGD